MICLDIEASGLIPDRHSIVSLGALSLSDPNNRFYMECQIWDGARIQEDALAVNGFTEKEIVDTSKATEAELTRTFLEWSRHFSNRTLAGQNVSFDRDMLRAATGRAKLSWDLAHRTIDSHSLCWMHMINRGIEPPIDEQHRRSALNLDSILNYCGIPGEPKPHNALTGALCHAEVIHRLLYNLPLLPEFKDYPLPW